MRKKLFFILVLFFLLFFSFSKETSGLFVPPKTYPIYLTQEKAVIFYSKGKEEIFYSPSFKTQAKDFGLIIPVPEKPEVSVDKKLIRTLSLVEKLARATPYSSDKEIALGFSSRPKFEALKRQAQSEIRLVEEKTADVYEIKIIKAKDEEKFAQWLSQNGYNFSKLDHPLLKEYINSSKNWHFILVKVNPSILGSKYASDNLKIGAVAPLRIAFKTGKPFFPLKLLKLSSFKNKDILYSISFERGETEGFYISSTPFPSPTPPIITRPPYRPLEVREPKKSSASLQYNQSSKSLEITDEEAFHGNSSLRFPANKKITLRRSFFINDIQIPYTLSFYLKQKNAKTTNLKIRVLNGNFPVSKTIEGSEISSWKRIPLTFEAQERNITLEIGVKGLAEGDIYLDALQFEKGKTASEFNPEVYYSPAYDSYLKNFSLSLYLFTDKKIDKTFLPSYIYINKEQKVPAFITDYLFGESKNFHLTWLSGSFVADKIEDDIFFEFLTLQNIFDINLFKVFGVVLLFIAIDIGGILIYLKRK